MTTQSIHTPTKPIPPHYVLHSESSTSILLDSRAPSAVINPAALSSSNPAPPVFLNPVQQYNRDISVVAITSWSEERRKDREAKWEEGVRKKWSKRKAKQERAAAEPSAVNTGKRRKGEDGTAVAVIGDGNAEDEADRPAIEEKPEPVLTPPLFKFTLLEALSATGLRAIRYAKEIPLLRYVVANDLSASAVQDIVRNVEFNDLSPPSHPLAAPPSELERTSDTPAFSKAEVEDLNLGKVRVNEGDACVYMYNHRTETTRFDCIDLDPYGSAVPFLDAAIGAVADEGLLCVTCTDAGVLAGHNYPEKAYTHYGGICVNAEYCHEVGLRLILNSIAATAARYGRSIEPLLSLSIDFYMRVFVKITTSPKEVKLLPSKTALLYYCHDCQAPHFQPMGRVKEKKSEKTGDINFTHGIPAGPPMGVGERCGECGGRFHIGGPLWAAPIHNATFVKGMLDHVAAHQEDFGTTARLVGMLSVTHTELETPLYFTPARLAGLFHCVSPPLATVASALLNAGYSVSRSHASPGSIKTDAPRPFIMDIFREWIKSNPVKKENIKDGSPASRLLAKAQVCDIDLKANANTEDALLSKVKLVRYQQNPEVNWGPARAAVKGVRNQRKVPGSNENE